MNSLIVQSTTAFLTCYHQRVAAIRAQNLPRQQLDEALHEADDTCRQMKLPFSVRAAAEITRAACTELLQRDAAPDQPETKARGGLTA